MWLEMVLSTVTDAGYGAGHAIIKTAELEIGGQLIDKHYADWLNIWTELTVPEGKRAGFDLMVGNTNVAAQLDATSTKLDVPLQFWFCRNPGLALPLIALQYHEVKLNIEFCAATGVLEDGDNGTDFAGTLDTCKLWVDYVYLDTDERRRFAQISHEYLIEQVQFTGDESTVQTNVRHKLNFNHPCKASTIFSAWAALEMLNLLLGIKSPRIF